MKRYPINLASVVAAFTNRGSWFRTGTFSNLPASFPVNPPLLFNSSSTSVGLVFKNEYVAAGTATAPPSAVTYGLNDM